MVYRHWVIFLPVGFVFWWGKKVLQSFLERSSEFVGCRGLTMLQERKQHQAGSRRLWRQCNTAASVLPTPPYLERASPRAPGPRLPKMPLMITGDLTIATFVNATGSGVTLLCANAEHPTNVMSMAIVLFIFSHRTLHLTRKGKASEARPFTCRVQVVVMVPLSLVSRAAAGQQSICCMAPIPQLSRAE